jgi:hypothetical protein
VAFTKFDLQRTKQYADEVVNLIREVEKDISVTDRANAVCRKSGDYSNYVSYNGVLRAELRRRSMDLTRALADLRRS